LAAISSALRASASTTIERELDHPEGPAAAPDPGLGEEHRAAVGGDREGHPEQHRRSQQDHQGADHVEQLLDQDGGPDAGTPAAGRGEPEGSARAGLRCRRP
jgi:hypothetical protein